MLITTAALDVVSLTEKFNTASDTWHMTTDLANVYILTLIRRAQSVRLKIRKSGEEACNQTYGNGASKR